MPNRCHSTAAPFVAQNVPQGRTATSARGGVRIASMPCTIRNSRARIRRTRLSGSAASFSSSVGGQSLLEEALCSWVEIRIACVVANAPSTAASSAVDDGTAERLAEPLESAETSSESGFVDANPP